MRHGSQIERRKQTFYVLAIYCALSWLAGAWMAVIVWNGWFCS